VRTFRSAVSGEPKGSHYIVIFSDKSGKASELSHDHSSASSWICWSTARDALEDRSMRTWSSTSSGCLPMGIPSRRLEGEQQIEASHLRQPSWGDDREIARRRGYKSDGRRFSRATGCPHRLACWGAPYDSPVLRNVDDSPVLRNVVALTFRDSLL